MNLSSFKQVRAKLSPLSRAIHNIEEVSKEAIESQNTVGIAVAVICKDEIHHMKGFGVRRKGQPDPITPTTLFQMASVSKPISATTLAILQSKGLCSLKEHPHLYLPDLFKGNAYKDLTIENMLNHTSGISYEGFEELIESNVPREKILKRLAQTPLSSQPGTKYEYNNVIYGLTGDIMAAITGKPIHTLFTENLFDPLGMVHACLGLPKLVEAPDRFYPHMDGPDGILVPAPNYSNSYYIFPTAAGVNACVQDLIPLLQLYLGKYPEIVPQDQLDHLISPTTNASKSLEYLGMPREPIKEAWYGLGWFIINIGSTKVIYHTGYLDGVRNFIGFIPDLGIGIIVFSNSERKVASKIGLEFLYQYLGA